MRGALSARSSFARRRDVWIILLLLAVGIAAWAGVEYVIRRPGAALEAEITFDGETVAVVPLDTEQEIVVPQKPEVIIAVREGKIGFIHSDCPDQVCVHTGFFNTGGSFAACLPNRVIVRVLPEEGQEQPDYIAG